MNKIILAAAFGAALLAAAPGAAAEDWPACGRVSSYPGADWRPVDPARHGWDAARLAAAHELFEVGESAAVMVVHRGRLIAQWGSVETPYTAQSVRKALLNSLVGLEVADGDLRLDATLAELGISDVEPPLTASEQRATVRDLLMSRSGIFHSALYEVGGWTRLRQAYAEEERVAGRDLYGPGDLWVYNNWDFNALGAIVERAAGEAIGPLFERRVARPIGMQDFLAEHVEYTTREQMGERRFNNVSEHRAYVFDISTRDLARYGLLYLGCGRWRGEQVAPRSWVRESIIGPDTRLGRRADDQITGFGEYGYLWQIDRGSARRFESLPLRAPFYAATGNRGHVMFVMPALDLVIAHQVATLGGVSDEAQIRRATEGSPAVSEEDVARLAAAIVAAHPSAARAFAE